MVLKSSVQRAVRSESRECADAFGGCRLLPIFCPGETIDTNADIPLYLEPSMLRYEYTSFNLSTGLSSCRSRPKYLMLALSHS